MIAKLSGVVDQAGADWAIIDVGGVGYLVFAASRTLARLPPPGQPASLLIETHVREDHIHLYGFADAASRDWFRLLITVQGVGARVALAVQSALDADELLRAVASQDKASLTRASGVGPKLAGRIVAELKDKVGALSLAAGIAASDGAAAAPGGPLADAASRYWFRLLITVQGVGARVALAVQSALDADELLRAVASQDKTSLTRASGVGPKLAGRIVAELKDKVAAFTLAAGVAAADGAAAGLAAGPLADAISALVNLGYRRAEAYGAVADAARRLGPDAAIDHLIRAGLKELSP